MTVDNKSGTVYASASKHRNMYDIVISVLREDTQSRSDDKRLIWLVYERLLRKQSGYITYTEFTSLPTPETITRARRKVQELNPELQANKRVAEYREERESKKGNFIFGEKW